MTRPRWLLLLALLVLVAVYALWFGARAEWVALVVFAAPPLWCAIALLRGSGARTGFWAGVLALEWFSHGVMVAWTRPAERGFALCEVALAVAIVLAASVTGLRARFGARPRPDTQP